MIKSQWLPHLRIGDLRPRWPVVQGGMAIRLSTGRLAAAVADAGGIGIIAGSGMSMPELRAEIRAARSRTRGIVGVNVMFAVRKFADLVKAALDEGIDLVVSGAGFSREMFAWGRAARTPIVPIVGSARLAKVSEDLGASAVVLEGAEAGGHLGTDRPLLDLLPEVRKSVGLPLIVAGGMVEAEDLVAAFELGADGVQMGIRFAASDESNAADALKQAYVRAKDEDIVVVDSPVGMPGRAIRNRFTDELAAGLVPPPEKCEGCLKRCTHKYCIREALCRAQQGDVEHGLIFSGAHVGRIHRILPVREIINGLMQRVTELRAAARAVLRERILTAGAPDA